MTQSEREAAIDLLIVSIYVDSHISLAEEAQMQSAIETLGWESEKPQSIHFLTAINQARAAVSSPEELDAFLADRAQAIRHAASRARTLELIKSVFCKDGALPSENAMLARIEKVFAAYA